MDALLIRIQQIRLMNFKNVEYGIISLENFSKKDYYTQKGDILGIYGQNGSGKTALIEAIKVVQNLISGKGLPNNITELIYKNKDHCNIEMIFYLEDGEQSYLLFYEVGIQLTGEGKYFINLEKLSYSPIANKGRSKKSTLLEYIAHSDGATQTSGKYRELAQGKKGWKTNFRMLQRLAWKTRGSYLFYSDILQIIKQSFPDSPYTKMFANLYEYMRYQLFVIQNEHSGMVDSNLFLPFVFWLEKNEKISKGDVSLELWQPAVLSEKVYELVARLINQMNVVLSVLLPGLSIKIEEKVQFSILEKQSEEDSPDIEEENVKERQREVELFSVRNGNSFPLRNEAAGVKKIISILSALIAMYNNPGICICIDELDSGIYEFLLGELLSVLEHSAQGQLLFTSHNLRALEMLSKDSLVFTTSNPKNRYLRLSSSKANLNLRDVYLRTLNLGGQKEKIYEETNSSEIRQAFRMAGRDQ
ncbi:hypothetical protein FACS189418_8050 [Clostridia bacterium]|nr:hypothetical protein FACS189418_8050 [Clostridia bacterium]